jgi:Leucine-rich repeat (LRR) protein
MVPLFGQQLVGRWASLRSLNLNHCSLGAVPPEVARLSGLRELRVSHNRLVQLPRELVQLTRLEVLIADYNLLTSLPSGPRKPPPPSLPQGEQILIQIYSEPLISSLASLDWL